MDLKITYSASDRLLRYVKIDTQSDPDSGTCPSTPGQKTLGALLVDELREIGLTDAEMDGNGYVYATIPSNTDKDVPVICLCAHMDTSPDCSGKDVNPVKHENYAGGDIILSADPTQVIKADDNPDLQNQLGHTVITADGTTLLGADNKAGLAEIMNAAEWLMANPYVKHGRIRILFTPDEEIGRGVDNVNMQKLDADFGYTVDGETLGSIEDETFSADEAILTVNGVIIHPGFAKNKLENAIKIAAAIVDSLPKDRLSPETTEGREGFIHPISIKGDADRAVVQFIIRSFETAELAELEKFLDEWAAEVLARYQHSSYSLEVKEQYRNMKEVLDANPQVVDNAIEALKRAGLEPKKEIIRGGTDGSRLSFMGLPCPNLFTGGHAFHSRLEWISVQDMQKAVDTIIHLCMVWEDRA